MKRTITAIAAVVIGAVALPLTLAAADDHKDHSKMDHGKMDHQQMDHSKMDHGAMQGSEAKAGATEASGTGRINSVDVEKKQVNLTHAPMPELGWPEMTMDLPVTAKVDLSTVKAGDAVAFRLKLGRDKVYRITEIGPAK